MARKLGNAELGRLTEEMFRAAHKLPVTVVLDNVRSLSNVGSVFRTCDAFRVDRIVLCGITGKPPDREIEKTALGATRTVSWEYVKDTTEAVLSLRRDGCRCFAIEQAEGSTSLDAFRPDGGALAFVFGNEVYGVSQEVVNLCDGVVEIPQSGSKHSLNVSVSAGIVLWDVSCKLQAKGLFLK
jgi:23S rRNA (guanosine2251-2'-O)-methyltransferase